MLIMFAFNKPRIFLADAAAAAKVMNDILAFRFSLYYFPSDYPPFFYPFSSCFLIFDFYNMMICSNDKEMFLIILPLLWTMHCSLLVCLLLFICFIVSYFLSYVFAYFNSITFVLSFYSRWICLETEKSTPQPCLRSYQSS